MSTFECCRWQQTAQTHTYVHNILPICIQKSMLDIAIKQLQHKVVTHNKNNNVSVSAVFFRWSWVSQFPLGFSSTCSDKNLRRLVEQFFNRLYVLPATQPTVSKHWREHKAVTITSGLPGLIFSSSTTGLPVEAALPPLRWLSNDSIIKSLYMAPRDPEVLDGDVANGLSQT